LSYKGDRQKKLGYVLLKFDSPVYENMFGQGWEGINYVDMGIGANKAIL